MGIRDIGTVRKRVWLCNINNIILHVALYVSKYAREREFFQNVIKEEGGKESRFGDTWFFSLLNKNHCFLRGYRNETPESSRGVFLRGDHFVLERNRQTIYMSNDDPHIHTLRGTTP